MIFPGPGLTEPSPQDTGHPEEVHGQSRNHPAAVSGPSGAGVTESAGQLDPTLGFVFQVHTMISNPRSSYKNFPPAQSAANAAVSLQVALLSSLAGRLPGSRSERLRLDGLSKALVIISHFYDPISNVVNSPA